MGSLIGNLTNSTGVQSPGGNTQFYPSQGAAGMALAHQAAQTAQPSTADIGGGVNDPTAATQNTPQPSQPKMVRPSFMQAAMSGPGGTPDAMSPGLSKGGKLAVLLTSGLKGALAGRAAQEQTIAQTGGHRAGGIGTGFQAGVQLPFLQAQQRQQAEQGQEATQQAQAKTQLDRAGLQQVPTPYGNLPAALAPKLLTPTLGYEGKIGAAQIGAGARTQAAQIGAQGREGAADITGRYRMQALQAGTAPITQQDIDQFGLPPEFLGKVMKPSDVANLQGKQIAGAPTVSSTTDPLGQTTTKTTQKVLPGRGGNVSTARPGGGGQGGAVNDMAKQLVEGNLDPSQLPKRSTAYATILQKANAYSQQKYGKPFDIAQTSTDYKFANEPATQNTLKYLNSLTGAKGKPGNLDSLLTLSDKIDRTDFPALNNTEAWARLQSGDPKIASYKAAVTEVADQVAKILQGGGSGGGTSDAKLQQAAGLFATGFNKEQMRGVAGTLKDLLGNRKREMVGDNRYLQKQFPTDVAAEQTATGPNGHKIALRQGKWVDAATGNPIQ